MPTGNIERRKLLKLMGAGATSVALAGCQGTQQTETTEGSSGGDSTTTEQTSDGGSGASGGNDFHFVAGQVFGTLDPAEQVDYTQGLAAQNLYDELITVDAETLQPTAHIAESWDTEDEGKTWVFTVRDDVTFSDGTPLTADDVAYSLTRMLELQRGYSSFWLDYLDPSNITVRDEQTVAFEFNQAYGPALATFVQFYIVNSTVVQENETDGDYGNAYLQNNSAGSGAYVLDNWEQGNSIEASAYEDYWKGWSEDSFDTFRSTVITEESTIKTTMQQGEGDMTDQYMGTQAYAEMDSYSNVRVPEVPQLQLFHFPLNCQKAPTDDINVRKAIAYAFDYDSAVNDIIGGGGVAAGPVPREMAGHNGDLVPMEQDLDKAKEFLDKADYSVDEINEIGLEHVVVAGTELQRQMGLLNQAGLSELGIDLEINPLQWARLTDRATSAESTAHMTNIFHTAKMPSPDSHTYLMYHPSSFGSYISQSWYSTDEIAATLEEARQTSDLQSRLETYEEAQALIVEGMPSVYIANPPYRIGINENVEGWQYRGVMSFDWDVHSMTRSGEGRAK
ncbi:ABC transporter substrate-binding protein [Haloferax sp. Atlit-10N]|uniref:ABC-type dipeptide/oligopeptide/nickel transport system, substrate binding protein n=1 Tax=Haloferax prahovense (strain DSM 18310 / JCM 13924 / TL6) TaxID=1227461 RepID=M0G3H0_HALPT|nr:MULTISPECIES: ABC transporter substrate-binding protein [Haloferax]ELZ65359.1 ABC-type dipeptide/oligopeptide/nickel transport system, substrate binding protein [Haloferax prahovense DSM 18310]RDZ45206.1 ABC transporter substrate-binding protein [Haloferax sp. Atlit-16N]RDZ48570.1 ABC transporter substrate-binding protein [Haloferax sp. Atlit-19N]RDZ59017.1 ABC transporter substrate-binding protein [Haloferax sp. Atlit-10N]